MATDDQFLWSEDESKVANVRVLTRMMKKQGSSYCDIDLVKGGMWGPQQVYCIRSLKDILKLECDLVDDM